MSEPQKLPAGWDEQRLRELAAYYDAQTEEEEATEIERGLLRAKLERRVALSDADPTRGVPWEEVRVAARERWSKSQLATTRGVSVHGPKVDVHYAKTSDFRIILRHECQNRPLELSPNSVT